MSNEKDNGQRFEEALAKLPSGVVIQHAETMHQEMPENELEDLRPLRARITFSFSEPGFGFGEISILQTEDKVFIDTECMGREKVMQYLKEFVDRAIVDTDQDPLAHAEYNEQRGRWCHDQCPACLAYKKMAGEKP